MRAEIRVWWEQAAVDLQTAEVNCQSQRYYAAVFFCQQAVEKALKAFFLKRRRNPQAPEMFSHSLIHLAKATGVPDRYHSFLRDLTPEYTATRYPTAAEELPEALYDEKIAARTLASSKEVLEWIEKHL